MERHFIEEQELNEIKRNRAVNAVKYFESLIYTVQILFKTIDQCGEKNQEDEKTKESLHKVIKKYQMELGESALKYDFYKLKYMETDVELMKLQGKKRRKELKLSGKNPSPKSAKKTKAVEQEK